MAGTSTNTEFAYWGKNPAKESAGHLWIQDCIWPALYPRKQTKGRFQAKGGRLNTHKYYSCLYSLETQLELQELTRQIGEEIMAVNFWKLGNRWMSGK